MAKFGNRSAGNAFKGDTVSKALVIIATLYLLFLSYRYLAGMKSCKCVNQKSAKHLKSLELILIVLSAISLFLLGVPIFDPTVKRLTRLLSIFMVPLVILFYLFFIYNVNTFKNSFSNSCTCAMHWERWIIYVQYGFYVFEIMLLILLALYVAMREVSKVF